MACSMDGRRPLGSSRGARAPEAHLQRALHLSRHELPIEPCVRRVEERGASSDNGVMHQPPNTLHETWPGPQTSGDLEDDDSEAVHVVGLGCATLGLLYRR